MDFSKSKSSSNFLQLVLPHPSKKETWALLIIGAVDRVIILKTKNNLF